MNIHLQTIGELSSRRDANEHDIEALTTKIEQLSKGIKELQKAKRVLLRRRRKLFDQQDSLNSRIEVEIIAVQRLQTASVERHDTVWTPIVLEISP